jgi:hypothetical protein
MTITAELHDGTRLEFPDGTDPAVIQQTVKRVIAQRSAPEQSLGSKVAEQAGNVLGGAVRGAGSIGATILSPLDAAARALNNGKPVNIGGIDVLGQDRRAGMDAALQTMGFDTNSLAFQGGKLGAEIAGTAGVGGAAANLLGRVPGVAAAAPNVLNAIRSAGMTGGTMPARMAGGAITGGLSVGAVDPENALVGAAIGGALPPVLRGAGMAGSAAAGLFKGAQTRAVERMAAALGKDPQMVAQQLAAGRALVPGSQPTVAQVLRSPQAGILERVVSDSPGGARLKEVYAAQNDARRAALERVAPVDPRGFRSAQEDFGQSAVKAILSGDEAARDATRAAYKAVPQDDIAFYLPDLKSIADEFFPRGAFGGREAVDKAVKTALEIGQESTQAIKPVAAGKQAETLAQAVRRAGGISLSNTSGVGSEVKALAKNLGGLTRRTGGLSPAQMAEKMAERGLIPNEDINTLLNALRGETYGDATVAFGDDLTRNYSAAREAAMGDAPLAEAVPKKVTLKEFDALRKSIGNAQRAAAADPERATEAAALGKMLGAMDERINAVVRGDGAIDEVLPLDAANALTAAQKLKREQVQKFRTGPQAEAFRRGSDNLPAVQGGAFSSKVWGNRPGIADDIKQFRQIIDGNPRLLGQFKSMVTTEGAKTGGATEQLGAKFVAWVDQALPGLRASFDAGEIKQLERIAADVKRALLARDAGRAVGSNTYQNAANALSLGMLDSPLVNAAANRIPGVNAVTGPALQWMREGQREKMARELAALLADPVMASNQLAAIGGRAATPPNALQRLVYRSAPMLAADR